MRGLKSMRLIAVGAAVALFATACGGGAGDGDGKAGGELKVHIGEPEHLLPTNTNETQGGTVLQVLYTSLIDYDKDGKPVNVIADSIDSTDKKLWTIKLKQGWKFHNGEAVNADSFINAWNYGAYGPNAQGNSYFFDRIEGYADLQSGEDPDGDGPKEAPEPKTDKLSGLKKLDDYSFTVSLTEPFSNFALVLGYTAFNPMAKACLEDVKSCESSPIGNGPFKMVGKWEHKREIKTVRNDDYKGNKAKLEKLTFKIFKDDASAYASLQSGEIDMMGSVPVDKVEEARGTFGDRFIEEPTSTFTYLGLPQYVPELKNKKIRQALSLAIDRKEIIKEIFSDRFAPAHSVVSPIVPGSRDDACKYCDPDPDKAKALLKEAGGWPAGKKLQLWFNAGASHDKWVQAVGNQIKDVLGIEYELKGDLEFAEYLEVGDQKKYTGPFRLGWVMDYPSMENYIKPLYGTQGSSNSSAYSNAEVDKLVAEGDKAASLEEGIEKYQAAEDIILEDLPVIPLWFGQSAMAYNDNVDNVEYDVIDYNPDYTKITVT
ncbi:MAG: peptide ABC transporter substrate-binding protein [Micromonosporaceae bacterium]